MAKLSEHFNVGTTMFVPPYVWESEILKRVYKTWLHDERDTRPLRRVIISAVKSLSKFELAMLDIEIDID